MPRRTNRKTSPSVPSRDARASIIIDVQELETFRLTLPDYRRAEIYRFLIWQWDIVKALYLLQKYPRPAGLLMVAETARTYGLDKPIGPPEVKDDGTIIPHDSGVVSLNAEYAMSDQCDTKRPVLLALVKLEETGRGATPMLLDGLHRLYRAAQDGQVSLECYVLSPEEERACRL